MRAPAVRTLKQRIAELNVRARAEQPPRVVQDVSGNGACFFLAANLGRQVVGHPISRTATDEALDEAAWADRCKLIHIRYMQSKSHIRNTTVHLCSNVKASEKDTARGRLYAQRALLNLIQPGEEASIPTV